MEGNKMLIQINNDMLAEMERCIQAEEQEDNQLRQQYGTKVNRMPSAAVNGAYKQSIQDYKMKLQ